MNIKMLILAAISGCLVGTTSIAEMSVKLGGGWDGKKVPTGQHCKLHGGNGSTPPMKATNLPKGTAWVHVEYNDRDYQP